MPFGVFCANYGFFGEPRTLIDLALESEEAGWDGFFLYDHIVVMEGRAVRTADPWTVLARDRGADRASFRPHDHAGGAAAAVGARASDDRPEPAVGRSA